MSLFGAAYPALQAVAGGRVIGGALHTEYETPVFTPMLGSVAALINDQRLEARRHDRDCEFEGVTRLSR